MDLKLISLNDINKKKYEDGIKEIKDRYKDENNYFIKNNIIELDDYIDVMDNEDEMILEISFPMEIVGNDEEDMWVSSGIALINGIRRVLMTSIDEMCIDNFCINEFNTLFYEEYIAHRLGLVPIKRNNKYVTNALISFNVSYDESKADENGYHTIYSDSLVPQNDDIIIENKKIILLKLLKGHYINSKCEVKLSSALIDNHSKWNKLYSTTYKYEIINNRLVFNLNIFSNEKDRSKSALIEAIEYLVDKLNKLKKKLSNGEFD